MMQILETLPGITVERCSLLDRSLTFAGQDLPRNRPPRRPNSSAQAPKSPTVSMARKRGPAQHAPRTGPTAPAFGLQRTKVTELALFGANETQRRPGEVVRPVSRDKVVGYSSRPPAARRGSKSEPEMEVSGSAALIRPVPSLSVSSPAPGKPETEAGDLFPVEPLPMPKSILKRTGSGMSNRSSRSLGVMSLDSGMAKLTASLVQRGKMQDAAGIHKIAAKHGSNSLSSDESRRYESKNRSQRDLENLPRLGIKSRQRGPAPSDEDRAVAVSPSKSVTFKLDHEVGRGDPGAFSRPAQRNRGGARWGVSFSHNQEHLKATGTVATVAVPEFTITRNRPRAREGRVRMSLDQSVNGGHEKEYENITNEERRKLYLNTYSSSALLRPRADGGITGVSGIHLMADPYRRYLMARAAEEARKFESDKKSAHAVAHSSSLNDDKSREVFRDPNRTKPSETGIDRTYAFLPSPIYHHSMGPPLPTVKRKGKL